MTNPMMYTHMAATGTKVIHSRAAYLGSVAINTAVASAVLTIYNNSAGSGETVAIIDCSSTARGATLDYHVGCQNGITAVMSGGNADVTITSEGPEV